MFCDFCGMKVSYYAKYCRNCRAVLDYYRNRSDEAPNDMRKGATDAQSAQEP